MAALCICTWHRGRKAPHSVCWGIVVRDVSWLVGPSKFLFTELRICSSNICSMISDSVHSKMTIQWHPHPHWSSELQRVLWLVLGVLGLSPPYSSGLDERLGGVWIKGNQSFLLPKALCAPECSQTHCFPWCVMILLNIIWPPNSANLQISIFEGQTYVFLVHTASPLSLTLAESCILHFEPHF